MPSQDPIPCQLGQFSLEGSISCSECPAGHSCVSSTATPSGCLHGEFSNGTHCLSCLRGYSCPDPSVLPTPCPDGLFSDIEGAISCQICPAGHQCIDKASSPLMCPAGYSSLAGQIECSVRQHSIGSMS